MGTGNKRLGGNLRWISIPSRVSSDTPGYAPAVWASLARVQLFKKTIDNNCWHCNNLSTYRQLTCSVHCHHCLKHRLQQCSYDEVNVLFNWTLLNKLQTLMLITQCSLCKLLIENPHLFKKKLTFSKAL